MTDPRIEAAARALCYLKGYHPDGDEVTLANYPVMDVNWKVYEEEATVAIKSADEASWRPIDTAPDGDIWMRNGNIIALVNKRTAHGAMSYLGWGYVYSPTHWMYPQSLPKEGA